MNPKKPTQCKYADCTGKRVSLGKARNHRLASYCNKHRKPVMRPSPTESLSVDTCGCMVKSENGKVVATRRCKMHREMHYDAQGNGSEQ